MIDRHGGQRAGLCVRPQVAVGAEENLAYLARVPLHLEAGQTVR